MDKIGNTDIGNIEWIGSFTMGTSCNKKKWMHVDRSNIVRQIEIAKALKKRITMQHTVTAKTRGWPCP